MKYLILMGAVCALIATAPVPAPAQSASPQPSPSATPISSPALERAYAALAANRFAEGRAALEEHLAANPGDAQIWLQLAYTDESLKDFQAAIAALDRYLALAPGDDRARLQRAYDLANLGREADATSAFAALRTSSDPAIAKAATAEYQARTAVFQPPKLDVYAYGLSDTRLHDTFYGADVRYLLASSRVAPYVALHVVNDTRSGGSGAVAQIFSDNAVVASLGLRAQVFPGAYLFAEGGEAMSLLGKGTISDLRYGINGGLYRGTPTSGLSFDGSLAVYSRYSNNAIGYVGLRKAMPLGRSVALLVGFNAALDSQRIYSNNYVEATAGIQFGTGNLKFRIEGIAGEYLPRGINLPAAGGYTTLRPELLYGLSR